MPLPAQHALAGYVPGASAFFASPRHTLLAEGVVARLPDGTASSRLGDAVRLLLADAVLAGGPGIVVGAVPFAPGRGAALTVPEQVTWGAPLAAPAPAPALPPPAAGEVVVRPVPEPERYAAGVAAALERMAAGDVAKVVLARALDVRTARPVDVHALLTRLAARDPHGYAFAVELPADDLGGARTLVGASPELLVSRTDGTARANPLAGSVPRSPDPEEDLRRGQELLRSAKNLREHAVVIEAVVEGLRPLCRSVSVTGPSLVQTATMWHLGSGITGQLTSRETTSLDLALALHPTPAVCGTPVDAARGLIAEVEPFDRGFYSGAVGWCDADGDGEWVVTIRCGEVSGSRVRLYAGAGIVPGSRPEDELAETTAKLGTFLQALGLDGVA
ncbi:isochorismate synthase [Motilibacter aurantiacus]|uniref:isochorismate synthase n=1 Tax=Motilibacter aurantiacus TaxID=2714955 RepID=UPI00140D1867|nr:isochorismate synthase [Motilibacter aurantiacus]NHC45394.1 isochorismate synthase [Motilibacter aurantiacus]